MIRVLILYPRKPGGRFDPEYYRKKHIPLVKKKLGPAKVEVDFGMRGNQNAPSPYYAVTHLVFDSSVELAARYGSSLREIEADHDHFTDVEPVFQIGETVEM